MRILVFVPLALACGLLVARAASDARDDEPLCGTCKSTGRIENKLRASADPLEQKVIYCSESMNKDKAALGGDELVCPKCAGRSYNESAKTEIESDTLQRRSWLDERVKTVDKVAGHPFVHIRTAHFVLAFDLPTVKVGQVVYKTHAAAHLYADRLEELYANILEIHGLSSGSLHPSKRYVYLCESEKTAINLSMQLTSQNGARTQKFGDPCQIVIAGDKKNFREDADFHQHVAHTVAHHIYNDMDQYGNWLQQRYGWVHEGLSHYIEIRYFGPPNTWCNRETGGFVNWTSPNWEANVKKALLANEAPVFEELQQRPADALTSKEHQFAWSYVDYLMWLDPKAMPKFLGYMKGPQLPVRDCLQRAYGLSLPAFVAGWEEFVKTQYSMTPQKGPRVRPPRDAGKPEKPPEGNR